jgi:hypothetical protein
MSLYPILCIGRMFSYCYHSVNGISYGLVQSEPIKRCPLYIIFVFNFDSTFCRTEWICKMLCALASGESTCRWRSWSLTCSRSIRPKRRLRCYQKRKVTISVCFIIKGLFTPKNLLTPIIVYEIGTSNTAHNPIWKIGQARTTILRLPES